MARYRRCRVSVLVTGQPLDRIFRGREAQADRRRGWPGPDFVRCARRHGRNVEPGWDHCLQPSLRQSSAAGGGGGRRAFNATYFLVSRRWRSHFNRHQSRRVESVFGFPDGIGIAKLWLGLGRVDLGVGEAIPDAGIEVPSFGFGTQQLLKRLLGNAEITINGPASEFQFQISAWVLVDNGIQRGGVQINRWHRYPCRDG